MRERRVTTARILFWIGIASLTAGAASGARAEEGKGKVLQELKSVDDLKGAFDAAEGVPRYVLLLSPT